MAINVVSVLQHNGGFLPAIIMLTLCLNIGGHFELLSLQPMFLPNLNVLTFTLFEPTVTFDT